jgi:hypothetical protein
MSRALIDETQDAFAPLIRAKAGRRADIADVDVQATSKTLARKRLINGARPKLYV